MALPWTRVWHQKNNTENYVGLMLFQSFKLSASNLSSQVLIHLTIPSSLVRARNVCLISRRMLAAFRLVLILIVIQGLAHSVRSRIPSCAPTLRISGTESPSYLTPCRSSEVLDEGCLHPQPFQCKTEVRQRTHSREMPGSLLPLPCVCCSVINSPAPSSCASKFSCSTGFTKWPCRKMPFASILCIDIWDVPLD